ncbi:hypothetical protein FJTKL_02433 [Diaporthe vaccinii]|uniref:Uncharacterized protein n=1 Tax=Diaporthe vaccinii TaxID=105482 RepID=A0ABR4DYG8_9PEZI
MSQGSHLNEIVSAWIAGRTHERACPHLVTDSVLIDGQFAFKALSDTIVCQSASQCLYCKQSRSHRQPTAFT